MAKHFLADRGYDANWYREALENREITLCIPSRKGRRIPIPHDETRYRQHHKIESSFARLKGWRRDAEGIARLLRLGWFRPVHRKSVSAQELRTLLGARKAVQQGMIALKMSLREFLRNFGLKVGPTSRGRFHIRIRELVDGNTMLLAATEPMLAARAALRQELAGLERLVPQLAGEDPVCRHFDVDARHWCGGCTDLQIGSR